MSEFKSNIGWLTEFYKPLKNRLITIALQSIVVAILSAAIPYIYIRIIDGIQANLSADYLIHSVFILLSLGILNFVFAVTNATRRAKTNLDLEWQFRQKTFQRMIQLDQSFYDTFRIGDLVTRLTDDVGRKLSWFACSGIFRAFESCLKILFCLFAMLWINPTLTLIALIPFPLQITIYLKTVKILDKRFKHLQMIISRVNETIETCFSGIRIIQAYCAENRHALKFADVAQQRAEAEIKAERTHIFVHQLYGYFWQIAQVMILAAGGWMVINKSLTIGEFVAFDYYILFLVWPMFDIGGVLVGYRRASVSIQRLRDLDGYQPKIHSPENPVKPDEDICRIQFDQAGLIRGNRRILNNITLDTSGHRMIAVVGGIGSGKSSLLKMICRFYDPDSGHVRFNTVDLKLLDLSAFRRKIGYVSQEPLLFTDTVENNIRFGRRSISDEKIKWAGDIAQLTQDIATFSNGYQTPIGLRGMTVSGGQKQRISIARALAGTPDILILDDATAHLDAETEDRLWNQIFTMTPGMLTFVTSHRTSTLERADFIVVLKHGEITESGRHFDLLNQKGEYYRIYSRRKLTETLRENTAGSISS